MLPLPKLSAEDLTFISQTFGIEDNNGDDCITWFHDGDTDQVLVKTLASATFQSSTDAVESEDVKALHDTLENNPVFKALIADYTRYRMPLALLTQLDQAEKLISQQEQDHTQQTGNDWSLFRESMQYKSVYELSKSSDLNDEWLLATIMGVTKFLWPETSHDKCDTTQYTQEVCDASRALSTKIIADNGQPFGGQIKIGNKHVIPQLRDAIYNRYLAP